MTTKVPNQNDACNVEESPAKSLILRPREGFPLIRPKGRQLTVSRRRFVATAAVATAGALMIQPLHVEAKWWSSLVDFFRTFAEGILMGALGQVLPPGVGDFAKGMKFMPDGAGSFGKELATPGDAAKSFISKLLSQVGNTPVDTAFAYLQRWLDQQKKTIKSLPVPYINGPAITTLGTAKLVESYLAMYPEKGDDFKSSLMLPTFQGQLVNPALSKLLLEAPPDFATKFDQIHEMESGTILVVTYQPQSVVKDSKGVVDRGQGKSTLYVAPSVKSNNQDLRARYKDVRDYINAHADYWTNEDRRKEFINQVIKSNSVIQPQTFAFNFENNR